MPLGSHMPRRCFGICAAEGLSVNEATLRELCRTSNGDVRLVLGQLQMLRLRARSLTYDQVKVGGKNVVGHAARARAVAVAGMVVFSWLG